MLTCSPRWSLVTKICRRAVPDCRSSRKSSTSWFSLLVTLVSQVDSPFPTTTLTRSLDLFWTLTDSLYLTTFKLLFIGSSGYIIYLMLNEYKPTHDPNLDTFKVQYLLGISALLALLFPHDYRFSEVSVGALRLALRPSCGANIVANAS